MMTKVGSATAKWRRQRVLAGAVMVCLGSACGGSGTPTLTVLNFLNWCSVTINGGSPSTAASVTASVTERSVATIVATPASASFEIGADPWFGVDQNQGAAAPGTDVGSGTSETSTATVTIDAAGGQQCVSVCCEEPNDSPTACPIANPCLAPANPPKGPSSPPYGY